MGGYVEAFKRAKEIFTNPLSSESTKECCREIFPQLAGGEDGAMLKRIENALTEGNEEYGYDGCAEEMISWLEKHKDPQPEALREIELEAKLCELKELVLRSGWPDHNGLKRAIYLIDSLRPKSGRSPSTKRREMIYAMASYLFPIKIENVAFPCGEAETDVNADKRSEFINKYQKPEQ